MRDDFRLVLLCAYAWVFLFMSAYLTGILGDPKIASGVSATAVFIPPIVISFIYRCRCVRIHIDDDFRTRLLVHHVSVCVYVIVVALVICVALRIVHWSGGPDAALGVWVVEQHEGW